MARKSKEEPREGLVGIIKLRLGACLSGPSKRLAADLHECSRQVCQVRNRAARWWQRWREDHPEYDENKLLPNEAAQERYADLRVLAPSLGSLIVASAIIRVDGSLTTRMPRGYKGKARYRWQAILTGEINLDTYHPGTIPLHNRTIHLCYAGTREQSEAEKKALAKGKRPRLSRETKSLIHCGQSSATVAFQLFSRESGRRILNPICRVEARQLTPGQRQVLRRVASREWTMSDSQLVYHDDRHPGWFLHLVYYQPSQNLGLDPSRVATLRTTRKEEWEAKTSESRPFAIGTGGIKEWLLGFRGLEREHQRLDRRRQELRQRYRDAGSGRRGHGRERIESAISQPSRSLRYLAQRCLNLIVADALRYCRRHNCGTLIYQEPSVPARAWSWFGRRELFFNWTDFKARLAHKCQLHGIELRMELPPRANTTSNGEVSHAARE